MRLSVIKEDSGYSPLAHLFAVACNDELVAACITADEEKGYAIQYQLDAEGQPMKTLDGKSFVLHRLTGKVVIGFHPKAPILPEDATLTPSEFVKKFSPQRDAGQRHRSGRPVH